MNESYDDVYKPQILLVDDMPANLQVLREALEPEGYDVLVATQGTIALQTAAEAVPDLIMLDVTMPEMDGFEVCKRLKADEKTHHIPVIFLTARDEKESLIEGFAVGAIDYIAKPFESEEVLIRLKTHLEINRLNRILAEKNVALEQRTAELEAVNGELQQSNRDLAEAIIRQKRAEEAQGLSEERLAQQSERDETWWGTGQMCGESETLKSILMEVAQLQTTHSTGVMIVGENGTGKELVARAIHFGGTRAKGPFVPVNCTAIPAELVESTFFGHIRGAFTGADRDRKGVFELADGGTLFLDEIGDMPLDLQAKLLRVLEDRIVQPVGGAQPKQVDVRVLAATNADLQTKIADGTFRQDFYYRLAAVTVQVPPLRERKDDLPLLAQHFLSLFAGEMGLPAPTLSPEAHRMLQAYDFPGNVRELKNMIEYALIKSGGTTVLPEHLPDAPVVSRPSSEPNVPPVIEPPGRQVEEDKVLLYVKEYGSIGNSECQQMLGITRRQATRLLERLCQAGKLERTGTRRWTRYIEAGA